MQLVCSLLFYNLIRLAPKEDFSRVFLRKERPTKLFKGGYTKDLLGEKGRFKCRNGAKEFVHLLSVTLLVLLPFLKERSVYLLGHDSIDYDRIHRIVVQIQVGICPLSLFNHHLL